MEPDLWFTISKALIGLEPFVKINFQLADTIKLYAHFDSKDASKSTIIASHSHQAQEVVQEQTILYMPDNQQASDKASAATRELPFDTGSHLIINQASWWAEEPPEPITFANQLRILPLTVNKRLRVKMLNRDLLLQVILTPTKTFKISGAWASAPNLQIDLADLRAKSHSISAGNSIWTFSICPPNSPLWIQAEADLSQFIFSFDPTIVKDAIVIKRERIQRKEIFYNEYYLLVLNIN